MCNLRKKWVCKILDRYARNSFLVHCHICLICSPKNTFLAHNFMLKKTQIKKYSKRPKKLQKTFTTKKKRKKRCIFKSGRGWLPNKPLRKDDININLSKICYCYFIKYEKMFKLFYTLFCSIFSVGLTSHILCLSAAFPPRHEGDAAHHCCRKSICKISCSCHTVITCQIFIKSCNFVGILSYYMSHAFDQGVRKMMIVEKHNFKIYSNGIYEFCPICQTARMSQAAS